MNWNDVPNAIEYFIYRSSTFISSISGLTEIAAVTENEYTDTVNVTGMYYYVIVAYDGSEYSDIYNCHYVYYEQPEETSFGLSILGVIGVIGLASLILRKRK